jgi:pyrroloquinoline quinone biosynthesis protein B
MRERKMRVRILGSAAGGGFPQWNCNCPNCHAARIGSLSCRPRTQSSIAVSADGRHWFLFNVSPDIQRQIYAFPALWPRAVVRHTPIQGVVFSDAELDHTLGLLSLREAGQLHIYATEWVHTALNEQNPLLRTLSNYCTIAWQPVQLMRSMILHLANGADSGLRCQAFTTYSTKVAAFVGGSVPHPEASVGYRISDIATGGTLVYLPAVQELHTGVLDQLHDCACLLIDGTCWEDDELVRLGIGNKTARVMGHLPIAGDGGSLEQLAALDVGRVIYIHINNTNPILIENSPQRQTVEANGIEVAFDGMELEI